MQRLLAGLLLLAAVAGCPARAEDASDLIGLWSYASAFDAGPAGELVVTRDGDMWRASIAGLSAEGVLVGKELRFTLPGDNGSYRGTLIDGGRAIDGMWRRREIREDPRYTEGATQAYAMPVMLRLEGGAWRGTVKPLPDPFTLYLRIFRAADGKLAAALRIVSA